MLLQRELSIAVTTLRTLIVDIPHNSDHDEEGVGDDDDADGRGGDGLGWLGCAELCWAEVGWDALCYAVLNWVGQCCAGLGWAGSGWLADWLAGAVL